MNEEIITLLQNRPPYCGDPDNITFEALSEEGKAHLRRVQKLCQEEADRTGERVSQVFADYNKIARQWVTLPPVGVRGR